MVLTGKEIIEQVKIGNIYIDGFDEKKVNPNSYNLRLHNELKVYDMLQIEEMNKKNPLDMGKAVLDMKQNNPTRTMTIPEDGLVLQPHILYLGRTVEFTKTHGFVPQIEGRSSIARLGLDVHKTAGWGDDGFENYWTLEIVATQPVRVYPFVEICQIIYMKVFGDNSIKYNGKYQRTNDIDGSKLYKEFQATPN